MFQKQKQDPRSKGPKPPFQKQEQAAPGLTGEMKPEPDHGEKTYVGFGRLKDRVALVTGGDSGIGRAIVLAYAREGADVAFSYLKEAEARDAEQSEQLIRGAGRQAFASGVDLSTESGCYDLVDAVIARFGRIDILINNAAYQGEVVDRFEDLTPERIRHTYEVNILAMFYVTQRALPHMRAGGVIINNASIQAFDPNPQILDYATTKAAIIAFTKGLAKELVDRGIRVNAVAPGPVWTPLVVQSFDRDKIGKFGANNPMKRPAQPAELAPAFVFLASDESRFVNGEVLGVTGGLRLV
jgi:hypothetical protein